VGLKRRKRNDALSLGKKRCAVGAHLLKVLRLLASAGILHSLKGRHGGYWLARPVDKITLLEVLEAVEGPVRGQAPAVTEDAGRPLERKVQKVCEDVAGEVRRQLAAVTLAELADD